jgi:hypothetical protein
MQLVGALGFEPRTGRLRVCCDRRFTILPWYFRPGSNTYRAVIDRVLSAVEPPKCGGERLSRTARPIGDGVTAHAAPPADTSPKPPRGFERDQHDSNVLRCHVLRRQTGGEPWV